ncbi:hypothetical protein [Burkholderia pseudomallei]|uniref:hypothetical protein n=1 Tax=Burkholderia pseudomallei TaxID=28450 RepID=UPI000F06F324|nr:hypothetical protein [Burkholderia pseudomallei]CAJ3224725.1 Uncharacterised protein [Burkholderia pseudomallei]CAJ4959039.1 Uncharacterised protein [Burkholderia pseudomallei]CAJ6499267.1 Uncharacterised protein [Burkholderia pseudomallei]CAJ7095910.1 Uncharacterised protein [Burkholderia pseudomallei]VBH69909.1 Uncharacterised protein [Burkholderia pseudomallei]
MNWKRTRLFMLRWLWYTIHDAFAQTFGWLTLFGGAIGGFFLAMFGIRATNDQLTTNIVGAVGGFVIGLGVYAIVAIFKTRRYMQPLVVTVTDDKRSPDFTFNDQVRGYSVAAIVQNRSDVHLKDCNAYVMNAPQYDGSTGQRFVVEFDLPPKSKKNVFVAYWFSRELPNTDDKDIGLTGPVAACFGGNVCRVPGTGTNLHIRIDPQDAESKDVYCRVWIDTTARRLRAEQLSN